MVHALETFPSTFHLKNQPLYVGILTWDASITIVFRLKHALDIGASWMISFPGIHDDLSECLLAFWVCRIRVRYIGSLKFATALTVPSTPPPPPPPPQFYFLCFTPPPPGFVCPAHTHIVGSVKMKPYKDRKEVLWVNVLTLLLSLFPATGLTLLYSLYTWSYSFIINCTMLNKCSPWFNVYIEYLDKSLKAKKPDINKKPFFSLSPRRTIPLAECCYWAHNS